VENQKNNKGFIGVLIAIIVLLLCVVLYLLFGKDMLNSKTNDNSTTTTTTKIDNNIVQSNNTKSADELYNEYLSNLKTGITSKYDTYSNNVVTGKSMYLDTGYEFTIKKNLDLVFTTANKKFSDHKISENVLNMFLIDVGNGGYTYLYFIKTDGSLNKMCIDCLNENNTVKVEKENKKNIVNITQGLFDYEFSGAPGPIFIDINGNVETE
jgi:hypothetical protein